MVGLLATATLLVGGALAWQAYQQQRAFNQMGSMMGTSMGAVHGTNPLWYVLGTLLVVAILAGGYLTIRDDLAGTDPERLPQRDGSTSDTQEPTEAPDETSQSTAARAPEEQPRARVLDLLPEDERRILEPVLSSPGITQIELRDRSDFSKSKVSQTVSDLETRGLLYRERQGRTYRVYPSDELRQRQE